MTVALERTAKSHDFEDYWRSIRGDALVPLKSDFNPADIKQLLPNIMIFDIISEPSPSLMIRLAGSSLREHWHVEPTGKDYLDYLPEGEQMDVFNGFTTMCAKPCGRWRRLETHFESHLSILSESTLFPLINDRHGTPMIVTLAVPLARSEPLSKTGRAITTTFPVAPVWIDIGAGTPE